MGTRHSNQTPLSIFEKFVTPTMQQAIATCSTEYSRWRYTTQQTPKSPLRQKTGWIPPAYTCLDILCFIAVFVVMGIVILPSIRLYWFGMHASQTVKKLMSYRKFVRLCVDFHFINTSAFSAEECRAKAAGDKFWKLDSFPDHLSERF